MILFVLLNAYLRYKYVKSDFSVFPYFIDCSFSFFAIITHIVVLTCFGWIVNPQKQFNTFDYGLFLLQEFESQQTCVSFGIIAYSKNRYRYEYNEKRESPHLYLLITNETAFSWIIFKHLLGCSYIWKLGNYFQSLKIMAKFIFIPTSW